MDVNGLWRVVISGQCFQWSVISGQWSEHSDDVYARHKDFCYEKIYAEHSLAQQEVLPNGKNQQSGEFSDYAVDITCSGDHPRAAKRFKCPLILCSRLKLS